MPVSSRQLLIGLIITIAVVVAIGAIISSRVARKKRRELLERLAKRGWRVDDRPSGPARDEAFAPFEGLSIRRGAKAVRASLVGEIDGTEVRVIEHRYTESSGNSSRTIRHIGVAIRCPPAWPDLRLAHENLGTKLISMLAGKDLQMENDEFNKRWRIKADDEDFAVLVLNPSVQSWLMRDDSSEIWSIADGWLACARRDRLREEAFDRIAKRPLELLGMLPPELDAYETGA